jgi:glycosyltransferase involved in cell wall biosynthesis
MQNWTVSDIRWANLGDLRLPLWVNWNRQNPLPDYFWQRIWEYPYVASRIPASGKALDIGGTYPFVLFPNFPQAVSVDCRNLNEIDHPLHAGKWPAEKLVICDAAKVPFAGNSFDYAFSVSAVEEMPDLFAVITEMIRLARYRVVITMDVSDTLGVPLSRLRELAGFLGVRIPLLPPDALRSTSPVLKEFGQQIKEDYKHIRVLGFTLDARDRPRSIAVLLPHWESWPFLKPCLETIRQHRNENLIEKVYVLDDASADGSFEQAMETFKDDPGIEFHRIDRPNKHEPDVGMLLDRGLKLVKEQYVAAIDADLFPLCKDWLAFPIWLLETYNCSSAGLDTGLSVPYLSQDKSNTWWQTYEGKWTGYWTNGGLFDNEVFTCTNNLYRIMPTALAKVVSETIGFTRASGISGREPYLSGCDSGVAANHFIDINRLGPKFNIPLTSYIGLTPRDGAFGQNISGLVFHFALSTRALSRTRREVADAGETYLYWVKRLQEYKGLDSACLTEMIEASTHFQPGGYDGSVPVSWYQREYAYMQKLLEKYRGRP